MLHTCLQTHAEHEILALKEKLRHQDARPSRSWHTTWPSRSGSGTTAWCVTGCPSMTHCLLVAVGGGITPATHLDALAGGGCRGAHHGGCSPQAAGNCLYCSSHWLTAPGTLRNGSLLPSMRCSSCSPATALKAKKRGAAEAGLQATCPLMHPQHKMAAGAGLSTLMNCSWAPTEMDGSMWVC
jgi:hypothetical protein